MPDLTPTDWQEIVSSTVAMIPGPWAADVIAMRTGPIAWTSDRDRMLSALEDFNVIKATGKFAEEVRTDEQGQEYQAATFKLTLLGLLVAAVLAGEVAP